MTRLEFLSNYFYELIGIHMTEKEINEVIEISHKQDTREDNIPIEYLDDCIIIRDTLRKRGYDVGLRNAFSLWGDYSDSMAAGWLGLDYDDNGQLNETYIFGVLNRHGKLDSDYFKL